jgi:hypothetical protein
MPARSMGRAAIKSLIDYSATKGAVHVWTRAMA